MSSTLEIKRSRELYSLYADSLDHFIVSHLIVRGVIDEAELYYDLREAIKDDIAQSREWVQAENQN